MEGKLDKASKLGGAINNWTKILVGLDLLIVGIGTTYYQIQSNAAANTRQDQQFKEVLETMTREFEVWGDRSDKRHNRAVKEDEKLHAEDDKLEGKIDELREQNLELVKEIWYIKGKLDK